MRIAVAIAGLLMGCIQSTSVQCPSGSLTCPELTTCVVAAEAEWCATADQLAECAGDPDGAQCEVSGGPGSCFDGVCLPAGCGNARVDFDEQCDDANATAGDGCSIDCRSNETCGNGIVDGVTGEQCDDQNRSAHDGCSASCTLEGVGWVPMTGIPSPRFGAAMTYDVDRDRVLMFGGYRTSPAIEDLDDLWAWDGIGWVRERTLNRPQPRTHASMAFDASRHEVVLFGGVKLTQPTIEGTDPPPYADTWLWNGSAWHSAGVGAPVGRSLHQLVYDAIGKRVVMYGGKLRYTLSSTPPPLQDMWAWDGTAWTSICDPCAPGPRMDYAMAYDPVRGAVILFGGSDGTNLLGDTWQLSGGTWTQLPVTGPDARTGARFAFDAASQTLVLAGGVGTKGELADSWTWDGTAWTASASTIEPNSANWSAAAPDPLRGAVVAFGGSVGGSPSAVTDVWSAGAWTQPGQSTPVAFEAMAAFDEARGMATFVLPNNLGVWESDGLTWRDLGPIPGMNARDSSAMAYDAAHRQLVLFGGRGAVDFGDTWVRADGQWSQVPGDGSNARQFHALGFDGTHVIMFGGARDNSQEILGDTWSWDGSAWTQLSPPASPSPRIGPAMAYDPIGKRLVLFGGRDESGVVLDDLWEWNGSTWSPLTTSTRPLPRFSASLTYDPMRQRLVLFGGRTSSSLDLDDTWELSGATWQQLVVDLHPPPQNNAGLAATPQGLVVAGPAPWRLEWVSLAPVEICGSGLDADGDGAVGCDDDDCWWTCAPSCPPATPCDLTFPHCGDGMCLAAEDCRTCAADCGACDVCGDSRCDVGETLAGCPGDCTP